MTRLSAPEWEDEWWAEVERARRAPMDDGDMAARVAWDRMLDRYGTPPPYAAAVIPARPYPHDLAQSVLGLARGANLELDPWQVDAIKRLYGVHTAERRNGQATARALVAEIHSRAQAARPGIIDELPYFVAAEHEPRRGWLGRLLDRMFG